MSETKTAMLGGGCFWCMEAVYKDTKGVIKTESGYIVAEPLKTLLIKKYATEIQNMQKL